MLNIAGFRRRPKKKKHQGNDDAPRRIRTPRKDDGEMFAIVKKMHGTDQVKAACDDGLERMCRITGKMKKRVWMREGDLIIIKLWDFQPIKADIKWRYTGGQKIFLEKRGYLHNFGLTEEEREAKRKEAAEAIEAKETEEKVEETKEEKTEEEN